MPQGRHKEENITPRQAVIMQEICRFSDIYGRLPSMQQLAAKFGIAPPTVYAIIQELVGKGYLVKLEQGQARPYAIRKSVEPESLVTAEVPLLGCIPCGIPVAPEENRDGETVCVDAALAKGCQLFALSLTGNSMIGAGFESGDVVVLKYQPIAADGDIVAASVDGEATLKRLVYTPDRIALKPENPNVATIEVDCHKPFKIIGKVIKHIKKKDIVYGRQ
jgi:repressor LexA